jgi:uncharacterized FlgJ-related protein
VGVLAERFITRIIQHVDFSWNMILLATLKAISPFMSISLVFRICGENFLNAKVPVASVYDVQAIHEQRKRDQFLKKLRPQFEATRSNLMNQDPSPSLDVCFG